MTNGKRIECATCPKCRAQAPMSEAIDPYRGFFRCCDRTFVDFRPATKKLAVLSDVSPAAEMRNQERLAFELRRQREAERDRALHRR